MKKCLLGILCLMLLTLTACGNKTENENANKNQVKCTASVEESGVKMDAQVIGYFDSSDKLEDATIVYDVNNEETAKLYCSLFKMAEDVDKGISVECSGTKVTIKGYAKLASEPDEESEEENVNLIGSSKEDFIKFIESEEEVKFSCK